MTTLVEELAALVTRLPPQEQARVLNFARELAHPPVVPHTPLPPGSPPDALLRLHVDPEVGEAMERARAECERIDPDE